ncbi:MAG TPA: RdgB/HAM1 family non-canonical purine NTP pyrophosphatase [Candidatus Acidoferrales bacterium]|nr:RdgB/HAM1 family non-canonical purine NTP pyrophosphatase [Candidatus Acidoferrales bacterium]
MPENAAHSVRLLLASSNPGKLRECRELAGAARVELGLIPDFSSLRPFEESAPTFAENAVGKALHYSRFTAEIVLADDSGLVVPALGGEPGVHSARYAGPQATDAERVAKLLRAMDGKSGDERQAAFVCVLAMARGGRAMAILSDRAEGTLAAHPSGTNGFGYDPLFFFPPLGRTFAEISHDEKNRHSHRGKAFRKMLRVLAAADAIPSW